MKRTQEKHWRNPTHFHDQKLNTLGIKGKFLNRAKGTFKKCKADITLNGDRT